MDLRKPPGSKSPPSSPKLQEMKRTIKLLIAYDGTDYSGWQRQKNDITIQGEIEKRLARMTNGPVTLHGAGRTDAGVHARGMVAHFHTEKKITCLAFQNGLNSLLPQSIRILTMEDKNGDFHARFSARAKTYIYTICNAPVQFPTERLYSIHIRSELQYEPMKECLEIITGEHDFASFETAGSRDKNCSDGRGSIRTILKTALIREKNGLVHFTFTGDGFLRHMIRNLMGTILEVGKDKRTVDNFKVTLVAQDRSQAGVTAPPHGLTLLKIIY